MAVHFHCEGLEYKITSKSILKSWIKNCIVSFGFSQGVINIVFTSDKELLNINKQFLKREYLTDIITFDYVEKGIISGDIFISIERIKENSGLFNCSLQEELHRVIIHGILHLVGYKDSKKEEKEKMKQAEDLWLKNLDLMYKS